MYNYFEDLNVSLISKDLSKHQAVKVEISCKSLVLSWMVYWYVQDSVNWLRKQNNKILLEQNLFYILNENLIILDSSCHCCYCQMVRPIILRWSNLVKYYLKPIKVRRNKMIETPVMNSCSECVTLKKMHYITFKMFTIILFFHPYSPYFCERWLHLLLYYHVIAAGNAWACLVSTPAQQPHLLFASPGQNTPP